MTSAMTYCMTAAAAAADDDDDDDDGASVIDAPVASYTVTV